MHMMRHYGTVAIASFVLLVGVRSSDACPACGRPGLAAQDQQLSRDGEAQGGSTVRPGRWYLSTFWAAERDRGISYLRTGLTQRLDVGLGAVWGRSSKLLGSANWLAVPEERRRPAISLGIGTTGVKETDTAAYALATKSFSRTHLSLGLQTPVDDAEFDLIASAAYYPRSGPMVGLLYEGTEDQTHLRVGASVRGFDVGLWVLDVLDEPELGVSAGKAL